MRSVLYLLTAAGLLQTTVLHAQASRPAEPVSQRTNIITSSDYPKESITANEQGMATVEYEIDATGRVTPGSCKVVASSRFDRLDRRSCEIVEARFRFSPALSNGAPIKSIRRQDVFWTVPGQKPASELTDVAIRMLEGRARCLAYRKPELTQRIVDLPLASPEQNKLAGSVSLGRIKCVGSNVDIDYPPMLLAGMLAEHLLERRFGGTFGPPLVDAASAPAPRNSTEAVAQCVVRRDLDGARGLLGVVPTGPEEAAMVRRLVPHLKPCIPAGLTLRLNRVTIRTLAASGLYREHLGGRPGVVASANARQ